MPGPDTEPDREPQPLGATVHPLEQRVLAARDRARAAGHPSHPPAADPAAAIAERQREAELRVAQAEAETRNRELLASIPTRYRVAEATDRRVQAWVARTLEGATDSLLILGPVGSGKTHEAFGAWQTLVRKGYGRGGARWASVPAMLEGMRPGRNGTAEQELTEAPLLLLDDLAAERGSEWTVEVLYRILDARYAWCRPTIITSNVDPGKVREQLGDRIASRLNGLGERVTIEHDDRRTRRPQA